MELKKVNLISKKLSKSTTSQKKCPDLSDFSRIVFGAWRINDNTDTNNVDAVRKLIDFCLELGITTFDHADIYGEYSCEQLFGKAVAGSSLSRDSMQLVSKCGIKLVSEQRPEHKLKSYDTSCSHIEQSVETSLKNLGTDYLDLMLIHRPNPMMDLEDTVRGLEAIVQKGKVKAVGVSNFSTWQFDQLQAALPFQLATNQFEMNLMHLDPLHDGSLGQCQLEGIRPMAWSPLAGGALFKDDVSKELQKAMTKAGRELQETYDLAEPATFDQVALSFVLSHPAGVLPIVGTQKETRLKAAVEATKLILTQEQLHALWTASSGHPVP